MSCSNGAILAPNAKKMKITYAEWITKAIQSSPSKSLALAEINDWMANNVPGLKSLKFLHSSQGWKNAVRHTLSVNRSRFEKVPREGRPSLWTLAAKEIPVNNRHSPLSSAAPTSVPKIMMPGGQTVVIRRSETTALAQMGAMPAVALTPPANGHVINRPSNDSHSRNAQYDHVINGYNDGMDHLATTQTIQVVFNDGIVAAVILPRPLPVNGLNNLSKLSDVQLNQTNASKVNMTPLSSQQQISEAMYVEMARFLLYQQLNALNRTF